MNLISKRWTQKKKRSIALLLACITLLLLPLNAYASATSVAIATSSNIILDSDMKSDSLNIEPLEVISFEEYEQTFIDYPLTLINSDKNRFAITASVSAIFVAILSACGVYVPATVATVIFTRFESWFRTFHGNDTASMNTWQLILSGTFATSIVGMVRFLPIVKEFLSSTVSGYGNGALDLTFDDKNITTDPFYVFPDSAVTSGVDYGFSLKNIKGSSIDFYDFYFEPSVDLSKLVVVCKYDQYSSYYRYTFYSYDSISDSLITIYFRQSILGYSISNDFYTYPKDINETTSFVIYPRESDFSTINIQLPFLVFSDTNYALSHLKSGTMGGLISGQTTSITADKAWSQLQQDALDRFGDTLTIPSLEAWEEIQNRLESSATADDVLGALDGVFEIQGTINPPVDPPLSPSVAYSSLSYVLTTLADYIGFNGLTAEIRNDFIGNFLGVSIDGVTVNQLNAYAQVITNTNVSKTGNEPNNDDNIFILSLTLASSFLAYLFSIGVIDSEKEVEEGLSVSTNVSVGQNISNPDKPDTGGTDLSGVLGLLNSILSSLNGIPGFIGTEMVSALLGSAFGGVLTLLDTIKSALDSIAQWDFADWSIALGASTLLALKTFAIDFGLEDIASAVDSIAQWDFADWSIALGASVLLALKDFAVDTGIDGIASSLTDILSWSVSDILKEMFEYIKTIPALIALALANLLPFNFDKQDGGEKKFRNFINSILLLAFILVALLFFFLNCLRLITLLFAIPANTDLFNENIMRGLMFLKSVEIPFFNMYLYDLLMGAVYFVVFMSIIATIRRKINHIRIKG